MRKVVRITESELKKLIQNIIEEQNLAIGQNFQQGQKIGQQAGQQARQAVNKAAANALAGAKQVLVTIGKATFTIVIYGGTFLFLIGKGMYKVGAAIGNGIMKFLAAIGGLLKTGWTELSTASVNYFNEKMNAAKVAGNNAKAWIDKQADNGIAILKWVVGQGKSLGAQQYAKFLLGVSKLKELKDSLGAWLSQQWETIKNQVGMAWDDALAKVSGMANKAMAGAKSWATDTANKAADYAGKAWGAVQGFLNEFSERLLQIEKMSTSKLLSETLNYKSIL